MFDEKLTPSGKESTTSITQSVHEVSDFVWYDPDKESLWTRIGINAESFKRAPGPIKREGHGALDAEGQASAEAETPLLPEKLKPRHVRMIAVCGSSVW